jgi:hypothetical protein
VNAGCNLAGPFWTLESFISRLRGHPEGPEALSARCSTVETEVIAEVPLATPQCMQFRSRGRAGQGGWVFTARAGRLIPFQKFTVCFFVLCNRHRFNRVPGSSLGIACLLPVRPYSDAGHSDLPLTLLGAPVSIGETRVTGSRLSPRTRLQHSVEPPSRPVRHNRGSDAIHSKFFGHLTTLVAGPEP